MPPDIFAPHVNPQDLAHPDRPAHGAARSPKRGVSDAALRSAKPAGKPYKLSVGGGLYLEVTPTGSKLWRWKYRIDGTENRYALGIYPQTSLKEAREEVEAARKLVKQGIHPARQKRIDRLQSVHDRANTFEAIAREWIALKGWEEVTKKRRLDMLQRVVFPTIGHLPVKQISPAVVLAILKKVANENGPSVMAEAKRSMFGVFELAVETFRAASNPVHRWREALPKNKTQHKRALNSRIPSFWRTHIGLIFSRYHGDSELNPL